MKNSIRFVEILVTTETRVLNNKIFQAFEYDKKDKNSKFILDSRYILYEKFERKIRENAIYADGIVFSERVNYNGKVVLVYDVEEKEALDKIDRSKKMFRIVDYAPPNPGCAYCVHKQTIDENFFKCCYKDRVMSKEFKTCKYFKQRQLYKT